MKLFHRTDAAESILTSGFRDGTGPYKTDALIGVFLASTALDVNEGPTGDQLLEVVLTDDLDIGAYELVEDGKPYREWCIPSQLLNEHGSVRLLNREEVEELEASRWLG